MTKTNLTIFQTPNTVEPFILTNVTFLILGLCTAPTSATVSGSPMTTSCVAVHSRSSPDRMTKERRRTLPSDTESMFRTVMGTLRRIWFTGSVGSRRAEGNQSGCGLWVRLSCVAERWCNRIQFVGVNILDLCCFPPIHFRSCSERLIISKIGRWYK